MLNLSELEQFVAFADCRTLSRAAEALHLSQPTVTRSMKHVEDSFGVPLFVRGKNKIELNETGKLAVELSRNLLAGAQAAADQVQAFYRRLHTIAVESCAPAPLWSLLPLLSAYFPEQAISSKLSEISVILENVRSGRSEIGILPCPVSSDGLYCVPVLRERLSVCVPPAHSLASLGAVTFQELNGFHCLLRSEIGFWDKMCRQKMPDSRFLVQTDEFAFQELVKESSLPCFTTNLVSGRKDYLAGRKVLPVSDKEADVTYSLLYRGKEYHEIARKMQSSVS